MNLEQIVTSDLEDDIQKECETWACWSELSEMEQEEVFEGYLEIAIKAAKLGAAWSDAQDRL